ncbi:MAG: Gfo/Idh/MocA family oxidoreductase [Pseudomonadota bacterium]
MEQPIRWGILGAAAFAQKHMAPAIHAAQGAALAALATSSPGKADAFAAFAPGLRVHDSYDALLADPEIDAVYVPLPNHLHVEWTEKCLAAGKPVLTEKPIAMAERDFDRLIAARDKAGLLAAEAYMILHHPQWQRARALVAEGAIGDVLHVHGAFSYDNRDPANIRNRPETGGGGLRDIGVYPIGAARYVTGQEPVLLDTHLVYEGGVDTYAEATCTLGDARFSFRVSTRASLWQEMTFHGSDGVLRLSAPFNAGNFGPAKLHLLRPGQGEETQMYFSDAQYVLQVEAFGHTLRTGAPYPVPLEFSRGTQALIDKMFAAAPA